MLKKKHVLIILYQNLTRRTKNFKENLLTRDFTLRPLSASLTIWHRLKRPARAHIYYSRVGFRLQKHFKLVLNDFDQLVL